MLLDTGCERNICPRRVLPHATLEPTGHRLFASNGTVIPLLGQVSTVIKVGGAEWPVTFVVTEAVHEVILGMPFLTQNQCQWDFGRGKIKISGRTVKLHSRPSLQQVRRIFAAEDVVVPARHMLDVSVRIAWPNLRTTAAGWIVEPRRSEGGVVGARTLLNDAAVESSVRVINLSDRDRHLRQGTWMGDAEPVTMTECCGDISGKDVSNEVGGVVDSTSENGRNCQAGNGLTARQEQPSDSAVHAARQSQLASMTQSEDYGPPEGTTINVVTEEPVHISVPSQTAEKENLSAGVGAEDSNLNFSHIQCMIEKLPEELPAEERAKAIELIRRNADVFSRDDHDIGRTHLLSHTIETGSARPFKQQLRRHPQTYLPVIDGHVQDMLQREIIEPATGPWASNVVLVRKSDGTLRFCVDYRALNAVTLKDAYPLPRIDACLESLGGSKYFSTLDAGSAYWQVPIVDEQSKDKTAFVTRQGLWRFKVLAFGLCNAPAVFQRLMDIVLSGLQWQICLAFLDDIMIFASTFELH
ncbi:MAG TPA: reverse transcriptase family protein, partial [Methylomicrobium sp.]|nr:reverse transcriptase family protein [Methylomicrobium sp.]